MRSESRYYQGRYTPKFPQKYKGKLGEIIYRSSWELKFMKWCDLNENVIEWSSESLVIPYYYPLDNKFHRYFPDFWVKNRLTNGTVKEYLIEIKPAAEMVEPKPPTKKTASYVRRVQTYVKNQSKWQAATLFCENKQKEGSNIEFVVLNEKDLHIA